MVLFHSAYPGSLHSNLGEISLKKNDKKYSATLDEEQNTQVRNIIHTSEIPRKAVAVGLVETKP